MSDNPQWEIIQGDALKVLSGFAPGTFDAVITDPPYASGGRTQAEKNKSTAKKYSNMGDHARRPLTGTPRTSGHGRAGRRSGCTTPEKSVSPAPRCVCSSTGGSFPQLRTPSSGLAGSGAAPPSGTRATAGPRRDASASRRSTSSGDPTGTCPSAGLCPACPACSSTATPQNRIHLTEKPLQLMRDIVKITEPGGRILDPFAGSGTTVLAAVLEGYSATGIEVTDAYAALARGRIRQALEDVQ